MQKVFLVDDDEPVRDACSAARRKRLAGRGLRLGRSFLTTTSPSLTAACCSTSACWMSGLKLQEVLLAKALTLPIIFITAHGDIPTAVDAVKKARCSLSRSRSTTIGCSVGARGPSADLKIRAQTAADASLEARIALLTRRERQVLDKVLAGKTSRAISGSSASASRPWIFIAAESSRSCRSPRCANCSSVISAAVRLRRCVSAKLPSPRWS
jgi:two-component system response regulator FixJ